MGAFLSQTSSSNWLYAWIYASISFFFFIVVLILQTVIYINKIKSEKVELSDQIEQLKKDLTSVTANRDGLIQQDNEKSKTIENYRNQINTSKILLAMTLQAVPLEDQQKISTSMAILNENKENN